MAENTPGPQAFHFGVFELNLKAGELRKQGAKIKLQEQPLQVLRLLLEHAGDVVTKEELQQRVWPSDTFVDFDHGLHSAMTRLREALGDSSEGPRFIETLARRGYRFIAPVTVIGGPTEPGSAAGHNVLGFADGLRRFGGGIVAGLLGGALLLAGSLSFDIGGAQRWLRRQSNPRVHSLAVLPLQNLSGDSAQDYFADGMTEALITDLGKLGSLRVISRTSAMHYKGTGKTLPEIARELNVDAVVEGGVLRSGERVRITAQLIRAAPEMHLWAESYERDMRDVLALQGEVARDVAYQVRIKLSPPEQARYGQARPVNPEALELYLKGRYEWSKWTAEGFKASIPYLEQAVKIDPAYAQAWAGLSDAYGALSHFGVLPSELALREAQKAAARKALQLDETLSDPHVSLSFVLWEEHSWSAAEKELLRAIALNPNNAMAHRDLGYHLGTVEARFDEAIVEMKRARELDPLAPGIQNALGAAFYWARRYDEALQQFREVPDPDVNSEGRHRRMAAIYERKGMHKESIAELLTALRFADNKELAAVVEQKYLSSGYAEAKKTFLWGDIRDKQRRAKKGLPGPEFGATFYGISIAGDYALLGEKDKAFLWLDKAFRDNETLVLVLKVGDRFDGLRSDPRFADLLQRLALPP